MSLMLMYRRPLEHNRKASGQVDTSKQAKGMRQRCQTARTSTKIRERCYGDNTRLRKEILDHLTFCSGTGCTRSGEIMR